MNKINAKRLVQLDSLQSKIKYSFKNVELLNRALTHSSYANEHRRMNIKYNERLEFLGDAVLGVVISDYIFKKYSNYPEGELTKLRAIVVCEQSLDYMSKKLEFGKYLLLGKGEESTGGRERVSILADTYESIVGAIYLDGGLEKAKSFILNYMINIINDAVNGKIFLDYKTQLQEYMQQKDKCNIKYKVIKEEGPDHNKIFYVDVSNCDEVIGTGIGKSKKEAEQNAAKSALDKEGLLND
ncbi:ribonuclease III [Abyssisolibacter fermentans]|uniref:ribonuclease III n=1 Tax=Abyssisolibacter fermentans TaxID=1766203 RepID=UPI00082FBD9B|nr:ribonuclease III [Abyssisolibacter fermentans]